MMLWNESGMYPHGAISLICDGSGGVPYVEFQETVYLYAGQNVSQTLHKDDKLTHRPVSLTHTSFVPAPKLEYSVHGGPPYSATRSPDFVPLGYVRLILMLRTKP
jgi:hypothetical protein